MNNIIKRKWNQNSMVIIEDLQGMAFQAESGGHTFQISGIDDEGNTVALSGTPAGVMLRADGQDVTLTCSASEGVISATLPANAYSVPGRFGLTIFLTSDGQKTAIYAAVGTVGKTSSGTVAPPAGSDVVTLVNQINTAIAAIPASYNSCFAPAYSTSGLYSVGQYVTYDGKLYRCNTAITTAETWTAAHWTQTNLGADVYDLKSALSANTVNAASANIADANTVFASGAHTNILDMDAQADDDYSAKIEYVGLGIKPIDTTVWNQNYFFTPNLVSGQKYKLSAHFFGETNQWGTSSIRIYRGSDALLNFNATGEQNLTGEFTSDGTEKIRVTVSNASTFKIYSLTLIKVATALSPTFQQFLASFIDARVGNPLKYGGHIAAANYNTLLPDLNDAPVNSYYTGFTGDATKLPSNCPLTTTLPFVVKTYGTNGYVVYQEFTIFSNSSSLDPNQISGLTWRRILIGTPGNRSQFYAWISDDGVQNMHIQAIEKTVRPVITVRKSATADEANLVYNNFYKALKDAYANNYDVYVCAGEYDIVDEYIAVEGQSVFDAIDNRWVGVPLGHGMTVKCDAQSFFTCNITAAKSVNYLTVGKWFAVLLPLDGGFRIEGFNVSATNARYVLHDGGYNNSGEFCNHEVINCQMRLDNTELGMYKQCIGGGLLSGGVHVIIKDCVFDSVGIADGSGAVTYHNVSDTATGATSYNTYDISGCYFRTGTVQCRKHGTETPVSPFMVHDNFLRGQPQISFESPDDSIDNMELLAWNNTIQASN